jgi:catechol 2,3-dioxygenase-like lactoylglutathione lyase family enzyme
MRVSVRYIVNDVDAAVAFYSKTLGFTLDMQPGPDFARLSRGEVHLLLNRPGP